MVDVNRAARQQIAQRLQFGGEGDRSLRPNPEQGISAEGIPACDKTFLIAVPDDDGKVPFQPRESLGAELSVQAERQRSIADPAFLGELGRQTEDYVSENVMAIVKPPGKHRRMACEARKSDQLNGAMASVRPEQPELNLSRTA